MEGQRLRLASDGRGGCAAMGAARVWLVRALTSQQSILRYLQVGLILRHERHVHRRRPDGRRLRHVRLDR